MIFILRSNDVLPDPRVEKYISFFKETDIKYKIIAWNRSKDILKKDNTKYYHLEAKYGEGQKNIFNIIRWNIFLIKVLFEKRSDYRIIHACDFDTVLPAIFMRIFGKKVIFDIFDYYTASRDLNNKLIRWIVIQLENLAVKISDVVIICEPERQEQLQTEPKKLLVMPNIPKYNSFTKQNDIQIGDIIKISYVGVLEKNRGIESLLSVVANNKQLYLDIAGFGRLDNVIHCYAHKYKNIKFHQKVNYEEALSIMRESHIIYAMYYKTNLNHLYAAPNKYYESLFLGRPLITTEGTLVGRKVKEYNTGFVIGENKKEIVNLFNNPNIEKEIVEKGNNAVKLWEDKYKDYISHFFNNTYLKELQ